VSQHERVPPVEAGRSRLAAALLARKSAPAPLAPNQERLFVLQQLEPTSTAYTETVVVRLTGDLRREDLLEAVRSLPERHEWLRSRVEVGPDSPLQVLDTGLRARLDVVDLGVGRVPPSRYELGPHASAWLDALVGEPFDLQVGPVWRAGLATLGPDDHLLVLTVHHVACDATSLGVLLEEVGDRYDASVTGTAYQVERTPSPRDLARTVRTLQSSAAAQAAVQRHADALAGADLGARWPGGDNRADGAAEGTEGAATDTVLQHVPAPVVRRLRRVAAEHGLTPFAVVSAAIGAGLADRLQVGSPVLGVPVDLRAHLPGSEDVVAFLVETVAVAVPDVRAGSLLAAARTVRDTVTDGLAQPPRFDDVVTALRARGALPVTGTPVQAYVTWLDGGETETLGEHGPAVEHVDRPGVDAKFDMAWTAVERGQALDLRLEYDRTQLGRADVEGLLDHVVRVLDVATASPTTPIAALELLEGTELARLQAWEGGPGPVPQQDLLSHVLAGMAPREQPVLLTGTDTLTAGDLLGLVERLAGALRTIGVGPGTRVAVASQRVPGMVVALLAVLRAGATYLPVDPAHPPARQRELARAARVGAVVGLPAWAGPLAGDLGVPAVVADRHGRPVGPQTAPGAGPGSEADAQARAWPVRDPGDLAYVMFTSGSSGTPKAVRVHDAAVVARVESYREVLAAGGVRFLLQSTLTFDASTYLFWVLATGGCLVLPTDEEAVDPTALVAATLRHGVTDVFFVPPLYEAVLRVAAPGSLASLRRVCVGGDVLPPELARLHHDLVPDTVLHDAYGPTEVVVTAVSTPVSGSDAAAGGSVPIGRPHPGTTARVVDRSGRRVPVGTVGELHLGGPAVADGYDDPATGSRVASASGDVTARPFYARDAGSGALVAWYATGDLARWREDGRLEYLGRRDRQVKLRSQRVGLDEVEAAVRALPGVAEAAVELVGAGAARRLVAVLAPQAAAATVRDALSDVLPEAWLPDLVVGVAALPRTASGKLDRAALRDPEGLPATSTGTDRGPHGTLMGDPGPASVHERTVLSVVQDLLGVSDMGMDDDFFASGGNSLLAARLMGRLSTVLGVTVPLHELADGSSVRAIAALTEQAAGHHEAAPQDTIRLVPVRRSGTGAPVVLVARDGATSLVLLHVLSRLDPERPVWTLLRAMPPLGLQVPDLVRDGEAAAAVLTGQFPTGPVHLLGHSASGLVALEAARALGDRVGVTVLLDTVPPATWADPLARLLDSGRVLVRGHRVRRALRAAGPAGLDSGGVRSLRTYQDTAASHRTRLRAVDLPLTLLTSTEARDGQGSDDLGWGRWAEHLTTVPLAGDHHQLLLQPDVSRTAALLVAALRR